MRAFFQLLGVVLYFWICRVFPRAFDDAIKLAKWNVYGTLITFLTTIIAANLYGYIYGQDAGDQKLVWYAMCTLTGFLVVLFPAFIISFAHAPYALYHEALGDLAITNEKLSESEANTAQALDDVEKARKNNPETNKARARLQGFISDYANVQDLCKSKNKDAISRLYYIDLDAKEYMKEVGGDMKKFSGRYGVNGSYTNKAFYNDKDYELVMNTCSVRLEYLRFLLEQYG